MHKTPHHWIISGNGESLLLLNLNSVTNEDQLYLYLFAPYSFSVHLDHIATTHVSVIAYFVASLLVSNTTGLDMA